DRGFESRRFRASLVLELTKFSKIVPSLSIAAGFGLISFAAVGQKPAAALDPAQAPFFESKVRPLLVASCVGFIGNEVHDGGFSLDKAITAERAEEVVRRLKGEGGKPRMPLGSALPPDKIAAIEKWVKDGAVWPSSVAVAAPNLMEKGK